MKWRGAMVGLVAAATVMTAPGAHAAEVRIGLNGARPSSWPVVSDFLAGSGFTQERWLSFASDVGGNWLPGMEAIALDYPAQLGPLWGPGALSGDESIDIGQQRLHEALLAEVAKGNTVSVAGLSMGSLVIDRELAYLAEHPTGVPVDAVTFYVFGDEARGFGQTYAPGVTVPFFGVTFDPVPETEYDVVVVAAQWDGWANPPDRPWHLVSVLNAVMGVAYNVDGSNDHSMAATVPESDAVLVSEVVNSKGGKTTTYLIPGANLPLTRPLRQLGFDDAVVDGLDRALMKLIEAGYSTMTPELGPHFEHGRLVWTKPQPQAAPDTVSRIDAAAGENELRTVDDTASLAEPKESPSEDESDQGASDAVALDAVVADGGDADTDNGVSSTGSDDPVDTEDPVEDDTPDQPREDDGQNAESASESRPRGKVRKSPQSGADGPASSSVDTSASASGEDDDADTPADAAA